MEGNENGKIVTQKTDCDKSQYMTLESLFPLRGASF